MILDFLIVIILCVAIYVVYRILNWKPTMACDSQGDPDAGEACGYFCIALVSLFIILLIALNLLFAYLDV